MKIALLHYSYAPAIGGVECVVADHADLLARHGHKIEFVTAPELNCDHPLTQASQRELETGTPGKKFAELTRRFRAIFTPIFENADVAMIHNVLTMSFNLAATTAVARVACELTRTRFIGWVHDLAFCNPDFTFPHRDREPWHLPARALPRIEYIAVSEHRRRQFQKLTGAACTVIPNGIEPVSFFNLSDSVAQLARERQILESDLVLLHPTRIVKRKNIELGVRLVAELKARGMRCRYLLTGAPDLHNAASADYAKFLADLTAHLGVTRDIILVHEFFPVTKRDLVSLYEISDVLFYPSRQEGFGIPLLEAALHRLPVFCSDIEPMKALAQSRAIFFDPEIAPSKLADKVAAFAAGSPAIQDRKETLRRYSWESIYAAHLEPLLNQKKTKDHVV